MDELDRLGRPGAYRLGELRAGGEPDRPRPYRPSFARPRRRGPVLAWVLGSAAVASGVVGGLFVAPFLVGLLGGAAAALVAAGLGGVLAGRAHARDRVLAGDTGEPSGPADAGDLVRLLGAHAARPMARHQAPEGLPAEVSGTRPAAGGRRRASRG